MIEIKCSYAQMVDITDMLPHPKNPNKHSKEQIDRLVKVMQFQGVRHPIVVSKLSGHVVAGHGRLQAFKKLKMTQVPVDFQDFDNEDQEYAFIVSDNALQQEWAELDLSSINANMGDLGPDFDLELLGMKDLKIDVSEKMDVDHAVLSEVMGAPPFTVFDTKQQYWQDRRRKWGQIVGDSSAGRDKQLISGGISGGIFDSINDATSVFDPVLAEIAVSWFSGSGAVVIDPFAGGSCRGLVAATLGRKYYGVDIRLEQIEENKKQLDRCSNISEVIAPAWICGDSANIRQLVQGVRPDLMFSCPPYADLEVYSQDPNDISNMEYGAFLEAYRHIIAECAAMLKEDSFAFWVIGEIRDKKGIYRGFVPDTISAFKDAGMELYNEAVLLNSVGTAAMRCGKAFKASRKLTKIHQTVLVFVKGNPKAATQKCGDVYVNDSIDA